MAPPHYKLLQFFTTALTTCVTNFAGTIGLFVSGVLGPNWCSDSTDQWKASLWHMRDCKTLLNGRLLLQSLIGTVRLSSGDLLQFRPLLLGGMQDHPPAPGPDPDRFIPAWDGSPESF